MSVIFIQVSICRKVIIFTAFVGTLKVVRRNPISQYFPSHLEIQCWREDEVKVNSQMNKNIEDTSMRRKMDKSLSVADVDKDRNVEWNK